MHFTRICSSYVRSAVFGRAGSIENFLIHSTNAWKKIARTRTDMSDFDGLDNSGLAGYYLQATLVSTARGWRAVCRARLKSHGRNKKKRRHGMTGRGSFHGGQKPRVGSDIPWRCWLEAAEGGQRRELAWLISARNLARQPIANAPELTNLCHCRCVGHLENLNLAHAELETTGTGLLPQRADH